MTAAQRRLSRTQSSPDNAQYEQHTQGDNYPVSAIGVTRRRRIEQEIADFDDGPGLMPTLAILGLGAVCGIAWTLVVVWLV